MAESTIELHVYAIILPIQRRPRLNVVEETVLNYLREGYPKNNISQLLGFNVANVINELKYKKFLYGDGSLLLTDEGDYDLFSPGDYKHCLIFRKEKQGMFFDRLLYAHEARFQEDIALTNDLGDEFVSKDVLKKLFIFDTFTVNYNPSPSEFDNPVRKISDYKRLI
jgi:hypothetical protein